MDWSIVPTIMALILIWMSGTVCGMLWMGTVMTKQRLEEGVCPCQN